MPVETWQEVTEVTGDYEIEFGTPYHRVVSVRACHGRVALKRGGPCEGDLRAVEHDVEKMVRLLGAEARLDKSVRGIFMDYAALP